MTTAPLDLLPQWALLPLFAACLGAAMEGGYRLGQWRRERVTGEKEQAIGPIVASILGLVALVLGFTFSLAASRFDARRLAVLEEANAIGTTYLRARLLPQPEGVAVAELLREYVQLRIRAAEMDDVDDAIARSEELHEQLWTQAVSAAAKDPGSIMTGLFVDSLNETIDLHAKRVLVGTRSRVPVAMWTGLFGLALLGMAAVGYQAALSGTRRSPAMLALVLAFAIVLQFIADLDRGQHGLLRVSQQALIDLQDSIAADPAPTPSLEPPP